MTTTQQSTNLLLLQDLHDCFEKNKHCFSHSARQTFIHEYGHIKTALTRGFQFTVLMVREPNFFIGKKTNTHLFFYKNHTICYTSYTKRTFFSLAKGCSFFHDPVLCKGNTPLTPEDIIHWEQIVVGGLYEELLYGTEPFWKIAGGFGIKRSIIVNSLLNIFTFLLKIFNFLLNKPNFPPKKTSDYSLLKEIKKNPDYCKEINRNFYNIHQYLYNQTAIKPTSKYPLDTWKTWIN